MERNRSQRQEQARKICGELIAGGKVDGVLALLEIRTTWWPTWFTEEKELEGLSVSGRYPVAGVAERLLHRWEDGRIARHRQGLRRAAPHRARQEEERRPRPHQDHRSGLHDRGGQGVPLRAALPTEVEVGRSVGNVNYRDHEALSELINMDIHERREFWTKILDRCIKCYGCPQRLPAVHCEDCRLEETRWIRVGEIPPEYPTFHLIRAFHMADKCVGCFACQKACPMGINRWPRLHQLIKEDLKSEYGFEAGRDLEEVSPLLVDPHAAAKVREGVDELQDHPVHLPLLRMRLRHLPGDSGRPLVGTMPVLNHPISEGSLCIKGWAAHEFVESEDRLKRPLWMRGANLEATDWDSALYAVADRLNQIKLEYGPDSIGFLSSASAPTKRITY